MEWRRHRQQDRALGAHVFGNLDRAVDRALWPEITTCYGSLSLATVHTSPSAAASAIFCASARSAPSSAAIAPSPTGTASCIACPRSFSSLAVVARSNEPAAHKRRIFAEAVAGDEIRRLSSPRRRPWSARGTPRANGP